jgi:hypothetical protein
MQLGGAALAPRVGLQSSGSGIKRVADRDVDVGMRGMLAGLVHFDKGGLRAFGKLGCAAVTRLDARLIESSAPGTARSMRTL